MRETYPKFSRYDLEKFENELTSIQKGIIDDFIKYCSMTAGEGKLKDIKRSIVQFRYVTEKPFDDLTLKDAREFLALLNQSDREQYTKNGITAHVKRFLRWHFKDWSIRFDDLRDFRQTSHKQSFNQKKINHSTLLTEEQINSILAKENDILKKAFFLTLYESGARPIELRLLKWDKVRFNADGELTEINIYATKTKRSRVVYVRNASFYLNKLRDSSPGEFVFPSREGGGAITKSTALNWVREMGEAVGIKDLFPYLLRHSRATELYRLVKQNKLSKDAVQEFLGHSQDMSPVYTHLSAEEIKEVTKTIYKVKELPEKEKHELEKKLETQQVQINDLLEKVANLTNHYDNYQDLLDEVQSGRKIKFNNKMTKAELIADRKDIDEFNKIPQIKALLKQKN